MLNKSIHCIFIRGIANFFKRMCISHAFDAGDCDNNTNFKRRKIAANVVALKNKELNIR